MNTKKVTKAGGISIPIGVRREQNIQSGDAVDVMVSAQGEVILKPHQPRCVFCSETEAVQIFKGKGVCRSCLENAGKEIRDGQ